jgi:hypothetical protein
MYLFLREWFDRKQLREDRVYAILDDLRKNQPVSGYTLGQVLQVKGLGMSQVELYVLMRELAVEDQYVAAFDRLIAVDDQSIFRRYYRITNRGDASLACDKFLKDGL